MFSTTLQNNAIQNFCKKTGQNIPKTNGEIIRTIQESLACEYSVAINELERIRGKQFNIINMIGGGIQDTAICQYTANFTGLPVKAGPIEATAVGNIIIQAIASGSISSIKEAKRLISNSFEVKLYKPQETKEWKDTYTRFLKLNNSLKQ